MAPPEGSGASDPEIQRPEIQRHSCPVIVGPTAVGKTGLITSLAARLPGAVISLDSRQIYRGLRIGTAQPSAEELAACKHHLIDFVPPEDHYSAMRYRADFEKVIKEISRRGVQPVLVGGAGMYLTALREGFLNLPEGSEARLVEIRGELDVLDDAAIRGQLELVDPASAERIHTNDRYRSQRALEIFRLAGKPMSELMAAQRPQPSLGLNFPTIYLDRPVAELEERIARRTEVMLAGGWIEETEDLLARHPADCPGLVSIGYREIVRHLRGDITRAELAPQIVQVTRQYAKRQRTWFRHTETVTEGHPDDAGLVDAIVAIVDNIR